MNLSGKVALITGASSGIGEGYSRKFNELGAKVVLVARRRDRLDAICEELNRIRPGSASLVAADISLNGSGGLDEVINYIRSNQVDILINNAGRGSFGVFDKLDLKEEETLIALNITAGLKLAHSVIPQMKERRCGWIITVSSIAALQPIPYMGTYSATKAFNLFHSLSLNQELSPFGIKAIAVCPGPVKTEFGSAARVPDGTLFVRAASVETVVKATIKAMTTSREVVFPGFLASFMHVLISIFPRRLRMKVMGKLLKSSGTQTYSFQP